MGLCRVKATELMGGIPKLLQDIACVKVKWFSLKWGGGGEREGGDWGSWCCNEKAEQCVTIKVVLFIPFSISFWFEKRESPAGFICNTKSPLLRPSLIGGMHVPECQNPSFHLLRRRPFPVYILLLFLIFSSSLSQFQPILRQNPSGNWIILFFSGQNLCTRII